MWFICGYPHNTRASTILLILGFVTCVYSWFNRFYGIYTITSGYSTHHFHLRKSISPVPPEGHFLLTNFSPNFSQKFDQKLSSNPGGHFSPDYEDVYRQTPPGGQFLLDFLWKNRFEDLSVETPRCVYDHIMAKPDESHTYAGAGA